MDIKSLTIATNDIHLWTINPQQINDPIKINALHKILSADEVKKVQRYRTPKAQHNALITRAFIRLLLSQYAAIQPQDWQFTISEHGKPELKTPPLPLRFNLSHNNDLITCAICLEHDIGCDVESLTRNISVAAITKRYFSSPEQKIIDALPTAIQRTRFFEYWTLKEAFVKATGYGISLGLDTFNFIIKPQKSKNINDNIELYVDANSKINNRDQWYNCLIYPDQQHCIAICVNTGNNQQVFELQYFSAEEKISLFTSHKD